MTDQQEQEPIGLPEEAPVEATPEVEPTADEQIEHWKDVAMRKTAEVENIRRRTNLEKQQLIEFANERLITHMLPVVDDLHAAVEASKNSEDAESLKQGLNMIYQKAVKIFEDHGVAVIQTDVGIPFNVDHHEALMHTPSEEHPEGHVIQVVQRGYALREKVLRHAKVITSAGAEDQSNG